MENGEKRLEALKGQLGRWRKATAKRTRLPEEFWREAVEIAGECGLYRTAKSLPVDWRQLKKRLERSAAARETTEFVEVALPAARPAAGNILLERETKAGQRMKLTLNGLSAWEVAELVRALEA